LIRKVGLEPGANGTIGTCVQAPGKGRKKKPAKHKIPLMEVQKKKKDTMKGEES